MSKSSSWRVHCGRRCQNIFKSWVVGSGHTPAKRFAQFLTTEEIRSGFGTRRRTFLRTVHQPLTTESESRKRNKTRRKRNRSSARSVSRFTHKLLPVRPVVTNKIGRASCRER